MGEEEVHAPEATPSLPSSDVLSVLFERAPEVITIVDSDGRQLMVNAAGLRLLGFEEYFRRPEDGWMFVHPDDRHRLLAHRQRMEELRSADEPPDFLPAIRYRVMAGTGSWRWLETVTADMSDVPEVGGRVAFSRDVTEAEERAQALLESQARLAALVASFRGGAFIDDAEGRVLFANDRLGELFDVDIPAERAVGSPTAWLVDTLARKLDEPAELSTSHPGVDSTDTRLGDSGEGTTRSPDTMEVVTRSGRDLEIEVVPIRDGDADHGNLWLVHDITARRDEARRSRALLELEQQARQSAEWHVEQLAAYDRLRNDFVAGVSHELRTPLTAIASAAELLMSSDDAIPAVRDRLAIIQRNADRLRAMIEDLLLVGRLDAGVLTLEARTVRLAPIAEEIVAAFEHAASERGVTIQLEVGDDLTVWADPRRLSEILGNLVDNAVKFTAESTEVAVIAEQRGDGVVVTVHDHGPGIPESQREAVFERFVRAPEAERSATPGSGLGLAIVKGLTELHGGTVAVGASHLGGAAIAVSLPHGDPTETVT
jgi:PAS domain S-box-containing protein